MPDLSEPVVPLAIYSAALDEIYRLRRALAYEAMVASVHVEYKSFPKSRRPVAERQVVRMRDAARGDRHAYVAVGDHPLRLGMEAAGAPPTLTASAWEDQRGLTALRRNLED